MHPKASIDIIPKSQQFQRAYANTKINAKMMIQIYALKSTETSKKKKNFYQMLAVYKQYFIITYFIKGPDELDKYACLAGTKLMAQPLQLCYVELQLNKLFFEKNFFLFLLPPIIPLVKLKMTVTDSEFPLGYFYIVSKMNDLVIDLRGPETATVSLLYIYKIIILLTNNTLFQSYFSLLLKS